MVNAKMVQQGEIIVSDTTKSGYFSAVKNIYGLGIS
jgi:hypothetical protein